MEYGSSVCIKNIYKNSYTSAEIVWDILSATVGALKMREWKMQEWKCAEQIAGVKNAGVENAGAIMRRNPSEEIP